MARSALLAGATGLVGRRVLRVLLEDPDYGRLVALARRDVGAAHGKLVERRVDFDRLRLDDADGAVDDVFVTLGTTRRKAGSDAAFRRVDHDYVLAVAREARARGARQLVVVTSLGADPRSRLLYTRVKGEVEAAVAALGYPTVHVFRPSLLLGERDESRPAERAGIALARAVAPLLVGPLRRYRGTDADALARAMVAAAKREERGFRVHEADAIGSAASTAATQG